MNKKIFGAIAFVGVLFVFAVAGELPQEKPREEEPSPVEQRPDTPNRPSTPTKPVATTEEVEQLAVVKQLRNELKSIKATLEEMEQNQKLLDGKVSQLLSAKWEYQVLPTVSGGTTKDKIARLMKRMGDQKFEYVGQSSEGLFIFKRRVIEEK